MATRPNISIGSCGKPGSIVFEGSSKFLGADYGPVKPIAQKQAAPMTY